MIIKLITLIIYSSEYTKEFILVSLFINYCITYLYYNCKPTLPTSVCRSNHYTVDLKLTEGCMSITSQ